MKTETRLPEYQDRVMKDSAGALYQGERVVNFPDSTSPLGFIESCIQFHDGKIHYDKGYAVYFVDGHKEWWTDGKFITATPAYSLQERVSLE